MFVEEVMMDVTEQFKVMLLGSLAITGTKEDLTKDKVEHIINSTIEYYNSIVNRYENSTSFIRKDYNARLTESHILKKGGNKLKILQNKRVDLMKEIKGKVCSYFLDRMIETDRYLVESVPKLDIKDQISKEIDLSKMAAIILYRLVKHAEKELRITK